MKTPVYWRHGKPYLKVKRDEVIKEGAMHSWCGGELRTVKSPETIGQTPNDFSDEREFYNPIKTEVTVNEVVSKASDERAVLPFIPEQDMSLIIDVGGIFYSVNSVKVLTDKVVVVTSKKLDDRFVELEQYETSFV
jgi:hypothetical protein